MSLIVIQIPSYIKLEGEDFGTIEETLLYQGFELQGLGFFLRCRTEKLGFGAMNYEAFAYFPRCEEVWCGVTTSSALDGLNRFVDMLGEYMSNLKLSKPCGIIINKSQSEDMVRVLRDLEYKVEVLPPPGRLRAYSGRLWKFLSNRNI